MSKCSNVRREPRPSCFRIAMRSFQALAALAALGLSAACAGLSTVSDAAEPTAATSVTVFASGAMGDVAPVRTIAGPRTGLRFPSAVAVDARGQRYVANRAANSVTVYSSNARGNAAPPPDNRRDAHGPQPPDRSRAGCSRQRVRRKPIGKHDYRLRAYC